MLKQPLDGGIDIVGSLDISAGPRAVSILQKQRNHYAVMDITVFPDDPAGSAIILDLIAPTVCRIAAVLRRRGLQRFHALSSVFMQNRVDHRLDMDCPGQKPFQMIEISPVREIHIHDRLPPAMKLRPPPGVELAVLIVDTLLAHLLVGAAFDIAYLNQRQ